MPSRPGNPGAFFIRAPLQTHFIEWQRRQCLIRGLLGEDKLLPRGNLDAILATLKLDLAKSLPGHDELLLAGLQIHLRAQRIDGRR